MPPTDSKTKIRPQQSCLKCRERKVKCDRSVPCHACILRGLEAECTYLSTPEDRAQISQAEIIERLRREVAQLRGQLSQAPRPPSPRKYDRSFHAWDGASRTHTGSGIGLNGLGGQSGFGSGHVPGPGSGPGSAGPASAEADASWSASSPSSSTTTMTHSMTVTSPDSTESDNGAPVAHPAHATYSAAGPQGTQIADLDVATTAAGIGYFGPVDEATISHCQVGSMPAFTGEIPAHASWPMQLQSPDGMGITPMQMYGRESPYPTDGASAPFMAPEFPNTYKPIYPQGGEDAVQYDAFGQYQSMPPWQDALSYQFINAFNNADPNSIHHAPSSSPAPVAPGAPNSLPPQQYSPPNPVLSIPSSWKGPGKQGLLETLLETIGSCDEERVAQVVQVVRTSATPEEAVSGICQVLGIAAQ